MNVVYNPFSGLLDFIGEVVTTTPVTADGVVLSELGEYILTEAGDYLAWE